MKPSHLISICLAVLFGILVAIVQAVFPCDFEFQINPFAQWQAVDWYIGELEELSEEDPVKANLILALIFLRFCKIMLNWGVFYCGMPVAMVVALYYLENKGRKKIAWGMLKATAITGTFTVGLFTIIGIVNYVIASINGAEISIVRLCMSILESFKVCIEGLPWSTILLWYFIYTKLMYRGTRWNEMSIRPKLIATRVLFVGALWAVYGWNTGDPDWFPHNTSYGGCLRRPFRNGVDDFRRAFEVIQFGPQPIWYAELKFPKYPYATVIRTKRMTFGAFKGWCEVGLQSKDSPEKLADFYSKWANRDSFHVVSEKQQFGPSFVATKPGTKITFYAYNVNGETFLLFQQIPTNRLRWAAPDQPLSLNPRL
jgi:hypothetical protein